MLLLPSGCLLQHLGLVSASSAAVSGPQSGVVGFNQVQAATWRV